MGIAQLEPSVGAQKRVAGLPWTGKVSSFSIILILITVTAAFFRFHAIANHGFWLDEIFSVDAGRPLSRLLPAPMDRMNMTLYYILLHFWMKLGNSETVLRSMSVVFSVATVPFIYALGSRLFGRSAGLIAAWLLALNAFHVHYAQEARAYALVVFLATISTYLLVRNLQEPERSSWALYGVFLALTIFSHLLSILIVVPHVLSIFCLPLRKIPWKGLAWAALSFSCLIVPLAWLVLTYRSAPLDWVPKTDPSMVLTYLIFSAGTGGILLLILDALALVPLVFGTLRKLWLHGRSMESWAGVLVLFWFFLPLFALLLISAFRPTFVPRYLLFCLPGFLIAVSAGLVRLRPRALAWALGCVISVLGLWAIPSCYQLAGVQEDWRTISAHVLDQTKTGDAIFFYPGYASIPFEFYRGQHIPAPQWPEPIVVNVSSPLDSQALPGTTPAPLHGTDVLATRFWMILHHSTPMTTQDRKNLGANLALWKSKGWPLRQVNEFPSVTVMFFVASSAEPLSPAALPNLSRPYIKADAP